MRNFILGVFAAMSLAALTSSHALAQSAPTELKFCSGKSTGKYHRVVEAVANASKGSDTITVVEVPSNGSWDNLQKLASGECDAAIVQSDAWGVYEKNGGSLSLDRLDVLYQEYVHFFCNRKVADAKGIDDIGDIENRKDISISVGAEGGGTEVTWKNFGLLDTDYLPDEDGPPVKNLNDTMAINKIKTGDVACGLYVGGLGTEFMGKINALGSDIVLLPVNDGDFNNATDPAGNAVYTFTDIPSETYAEIQDGTFSSAVETLTLGASVLVTTKWENENDAALGTLADLLQEIGQQLQ